MGWLKAIHHDSRCTKEGGKEGRKERGSEERNRAKSMLLGYADLMRGWIDLLEVKFRGVEIAAHER